MRFQAGKLLRKLVLIGFVVVAPVASAWAQSEALTRNYQRGSSLVEAGLYKASVPYFARALALSEAEYGRNSSRTAFILKNLATVHAKQGEFAAAEPLYIRALSIFKDAFGAEHGVVAEVTNELSIVYVERKRFIQAEPLLGRVLDNLERAFGPDDPRVAVAAYNNAYASEYLGDAKKARTLYARALQIWQSQTVPDPDRIKLAEDRIAGLSRARGRTVPSLAPYLPRVLAGSGAEAREAPAPASGSPAPTRDKAVAAGGRKAQKWRVQLAAFRSREKAEKVAARLKEAHATLFAPIGGVEVVEADLAKGTFYRVGAGPVGDRTTAATLCRDLQTLKQTCIVMPQRPE